MPKEKHVVPSDDEIWANLHLSYKDWSDKLNSSHYAIASRCRRRGWRRSMGGGKGQGKGAGYFILGPCKECGESTDMKDLSKDRVCLDCRTEEKAGPHKKLFREELKKFLKRKPSWRALVTREELLQ